MFTRARRLRKTTAPIGAVAQLIERVVRNDEVVGLIPICSTILVAHENYGADGSVKATDSLPRSWEKGPV